MTFSLNPTKCNCSTSRNRLLLFKHPSIDSPPHPAKRSITENFFKFRPSFMCAVAILKSFIINYIYNILQRTAHTIRYCKITKKSENQKENLTFHPANHCSSLPIILLYPPQSSFIPTQPDNPRFRSSNSQYFCLVFQSHSVRCTCRTSSEDTQQKFNLKKKGKHKWQKSTVQTPKSAAR